MNTEIRKLSDRIHSLNQEIMQANPWDEGYKEVVFIRDRLTMVLCEHGERDFEEFQNYLTEAAKDIEKECESKKSQLSKWSETITPVFKQVENIISRMTPLLALL